MPKIMVSLRSIFYNKYERLPQSGYPERTSGSECGADFLPETSKKEGG